IQSVFRLRELAELVASLGATSWSIRLSFSSGRQIKNADIFPKHEILLSVADDIRQIKREFKNRIPFILGGINYEDSYREPYVPTHNQRRLVTCAGATILAALAADGTMSPCPLFSGTDYRSRSVWEIGFVRAWSDAQCMNDMRSTSSDQIAGCGTCANLNGKCGGGCRAKAYMKKGTIKSNDYHCNYSQ